MSNPRGKTIHLKENTHLKLVSKQNKIFEQLRVSVTLSELADAIIDRYIDEFTYIKLMICPNANSCAADCKFGHSVPHREIGSCIQLKEQNCPGCKEIVY